MTRQDLTTAFERSRSLAKLQVCDVLSHILESTPPGPEQTRQIERAIHNIRTQHSERFAAVPERDTGREDTQPRGMNYFLKRG